MRHPGDDPGTDSGYINALNARDTSRNPARQTGPAVESQTREDMVGGTVFISVPECGMKGNAQVLAIVPCPAISKVAISLRETSPGLSHRFDNASFNSPNSMKA